MIRLIAPDLLPVLVIFSACGFLLAGPVVPAERFGNLPLRAISPEAVAEAPKLKMVRIRASATEVRLLRTMPLDIVRIRPVPAPQVPSAKADFLDQEFLVEAVAPAALAAKLRNLGFDITEVQ